MRTFFGLKISTSGLSRHVIRVAGIMKDVYAEILGDINNAVTLHADETGWRVKGKISGGGSVSAEGANAYAILLSIHVTCKLRGISFPKYMKESLRHYIRTGKPMSLSTYSTFIANNSDLKKAA